MAGKAQGHGIPTTNDTCNKLTLTNISKFKTKKGS